MNFKKLGTSVFALSISIAVLVGCSGPLSDGREIPVAQQTAEQQADGVANDKDGAQVASLEKGDTVDATEEAQLGEAFSAPGATTGKTDSEVAKGARQIAAVEGEDEDLWDRFIKSEHYPMEASYGSNSVIMAARSAQPTPIQFASLYGVTNVAQSDEIGEENDGDPLETVNRFLFAINETLETFILRPVAVTYSFWVPSGVRDSVRNFLRNLRSPVVLANDIFQGNLDRAETTAARFFLNTTVGLGGLFDVATDEGWDYHDEDFGQTLGAHGVGEGVYLVLPVIGPSSARDGIGMIVDYFLDPLTYLTPMETRAGLGATRAVDSYSRRYELLDDLKRDSIDYYARIRSLYRQNREHEINNGDPKEAPEPDFSGQSGPGSSQETTIRVQ